MSARCDDCGRARTPDDGLFNPISILLGAEPDWYSGDNGELCPGCLFARSNTRASDAGRITT